MRRIVIVGANGQLGRALGRRLPQALWLTRSDLNLANPDHFDHFDRFDWSGRAAVINAAAYTKVDQAELPDQHDHVWAANVEGVRRLAELANQHGLVLVHVSSEYVFDGAYPGPMPEDLPPSPLSVYGRSKADGDEAARRAERHYLVRPSWVFGDGHNFVRTMADLADRGVKPAVVNDQTGRPTSADDLAAGIIHLLAVQAPYGTYNLTNAGPPASWADVARTVYVLQGCDPADVQDTSTAEYFAGKPLAATRPANSLLDLSKITATGFAPRDWSTAIADYLHGAS